MAMSIKHIVIVIVQTSSAVDRGGAVGPGAPNNYGEMEREK